MVTKPQCSINYEIAKRMYTVHQLGENENMNLIDFQEQGTLVESRPVYNLKLNLCSLWICIYLSFSYVYSSHVYDL